MPARTAAPAALPRPRTRLAALGSLTQHGARGDVRCSTCQSERVTSLGMTLTDGTPVRFTSCHACETRRWEDLEGGELPVDQVIDKTRKER